MDQPGGDIPVHTSSPEREGGAPVEASVAPASPTGRVGEIGCERLVAKVLSYAPQADVQSIRRAFDVANRAHQSQMRDNGDPYITHPLAVEIGRAHV